jgi:hypothetical protein
MSTLTETEITRIKDALESAKAIAPVKATRISVPVVTRTGAVWMHLTVEHNGIGTHAEATATTTTDQDPNSQRVNVGSLRLTLDWAGHEDQTLQNTSIITVNEDAFPPHIGGASATAWATGPTIGPLSAST